MEADDEQWIGRGQSFENGVKATVKCAELGESERSGQKLAEEESRGRVSPKAVELSVE